ncbi:MAG: DUF1801 domain-containing protein [Chloroflexi bacterium]|nr:DUF1801 domain-containing protein [Chloroflexota bacterium]
MPEQKPAGTAAKQTARGRSTEAAGGLSPEERAAVKERTRELKEEARANKTREDDERDILAKIAEMPEPDRQMAMRIHEIVTANAPGLMPRIWYGMPAYALDGKVVCFFQAADKFKVRYATFGFDEKANLDDGAMWATSFALKELTAAAEAQITKLVKKAVS